MSMKKIAELANVSMPTVSKAFSGSNEVSRETRNHIFDIAKSLVFTKNIPVKSLERR